ncbi:MAG: radical SAM peptide maturase, CXXX-repeat target family [Planctomycetia bacterium]|nr:radical SAM peptide maturase, CXXX-repeat target family [Planctomycetia bacterium]
MSEIRLKQKQLLWGEQAQSVTFIVTEDCQLRCKYCYICGKNNFKKMTFEVAKKTVNYVLNNRIQFSNNAVIWEFIGGEPFLEIDLIDKICDYIKLRMYELNHPWFTNYRFNFSTNGLMHSDLRVQTFIEKNKTHLHIGFSIDGTPEKHDMMRVYPSGQGCYADMSKNIPLWMSQFTRATKATIGHEDLPLLKDSVLYLWNMGIHEIAMNPIFENVWDENDPVIYEQQLISLADEIIEKNLFNENQCTLFDRNSGFAMNREENSNWCGSGKMLAVDTEGKFHPCVRFAQYSLESKMEINLGDIDEGYLSNRLRPFLALGRLSQSPQKCIDCEVASGCAWCQGHNYDSADTDTIYQRATYLCEMHKARVRANNYLWNKLDKIVPPAEGDVRVLKLAQRKGLQYLFVQLDSDAPSICYYNDEKTVEGESKRMSLETLKKLVYYGLTENLAFHFLSNGKPLEEEYVEALKFSDYLFISRTRRKMIRKRPLIFSISKRIRGMMRNRPGKRSLCDSKVGICRNCRNG